MAGGTIRYWAAARAAAGVESEPFQAASLQEALEAARGLHNAEFTRVLSVCSFVIDGDPVGTRAHHDVALADGVTVEVLPPFAGGSSTTARA